VRRRGEEAQNALEAVAATDPKLQRIFDAWHAYIEASMSRDAKVQPPRVEDFLEDGGV
jgi:hypothetical protein